MNGLYREISNDDALTMEHGFAKYCPRCETVKPRTDFHDLSTARDLKYFCCKECRKTMDKERHFKNNQRRFVEEVRSVYEKHGVEFSGVDAAIAHSAFFLTRIK